MRISVKFAFENRAIEVDERFICNFVEFAVRSMFGIIAGSLIDYEVAKVDTRAVSALIDVSEQDSYKIVSALAMVGSYGISRVRTTSRIMPN